MRPFLFPLAAVFACLFAPTLRADDAADAKAIILKAIKAQGEKPDSKNTAMTWKEDGKFTAMGLNIDYKSEWAFQAPDKCRFLMTASFGGMDIKITAVINGEKAWESDGKETREVKGEKLEYVRSAAYQFWVMSLTPLVNDKGFTLATAKGKDVSGKPTNVVKVTRDKQPAVTLYFDKDTGLMVKTEAMAKDEFQNWKEVLDENFLSDYKEANGRKFFTKLKTVRDGKTLIESTLSDAKVSEKLDAKLFEKP